MNKVLFLALTVALLTSCSTTITKVTDENRDDLEGVFFNRPTPYLLVGEKDVIVDGLKQEKETESGKEVTTQKMALARKELETSIIYLPDPNEEYVISISAIRRLGFVLEDGWRLRAMHGQFAKAVPKDLVVDRGEHLKMKQIAGRLTGAMKLKPGLYKFQHDETGFTGLKKLSVE